MKNAIVTGDSAEMNYAPLLGGAVNNPPEIVCLSLLQWDFAGQRAQRLMNRSARERRVFFVEEPVFGADRFRGWTSDGAIAECSS